MKDLCLEKGYVYDKEKSKEYREKNKERIRETKEEYYQKNRERLIQYQRDYRKRKKEEKEKGETLD